jgi:hypothetical protein
MRHGVHPRKRHNAITQMMVRNALALWIVDLGASACYFRRRMGA